MAEYRITYWRDIPSQVEAFDGAERVRRPLDRRFQELIDAVAMRDGATGTEAYLQGWRVGPGLTRHGTPQEVAEAVAAELEERFDVVRRAVLTPPDSPKRPEGSGRGSAAS
ncbi:MAG: virulence factor [Armatimonadota bacterium]|nr:virulence factor [Armatimonadota bacterium]MDR7548815.1 virulence factor [Armatimonadota bacterium]